MLSASTLRSATTLLIFSLSIAFSLPDDGDLAHAVVGYHKHNSPFLSEDEAQDSLPDRDAPAGNGPAALRRL